MLLVEGDTTRAAVIRRHLRAELEALSVSSESIDDVVLVISELVGNAVVHASAHTFDVAWDISEDSVVVRVHDSSDGVPTPRSSKSTDTSGRGLAIVEALSDEWGVVPARTGKQVWARIPIAPAA